MSPDVHPAVPAFRSNAETRRIYATIFEQQGAPPPQSLLITSGWRGEGKTTLACNLAIIAAREKTKKVLIIDCNEFAPDVHTQFGIPLPSPAVPHHSLMETAVQVPGVGALSVISPAALPKEKKQPGGEFPQDPFYFINEAKKAYDHIIIDTSSVFPTNRHMNDPMLLSRIADGVILVALTHVTPKEKTKRACCALQSHGAAVLGVVANQWKNPMNV